MSKIKGTHHSHQGHNFATILKAAQRRHYLQWWDSPSFVGAKAEKREMLWTVYPVLSGNHHLNFGCLGARCEAFYPNLYGPIDGGLYGGLDTDRLEMTWDLENPQTLNLEVEPTSLLDWNESGPVLNHRGGLQADRVYAASFPTDFQQLKTEDFGLAERWQKTIGEVIQNALSSGFYIAAFQRGKEFGKFIFIPKG